MMGIDIPGFKSDDARSRQKKSKRYQAGINQRGLPLV